ncbi:MAG: hypothetical protein WHX52_19605 [Anaerolineae bacterium]
MFDYFIGWIRQEPFISVLLMCVALGVFRAVSGGKADQEAVSVFWPWVRRLVKAASIALLCVYFLLACYEVFAKTVEEFSTSHQKITEDNWRTVQSAWGMALKQSELRVTHFVEVKDRDRPMTDASAQNVPYSETGHRQLLPLNSITGFTGTVRIQLSDSERRRQGAALYNTYTAHTCYTYEVTNVSDRPTEVEFLFPFSSGCVLYEDFTVLMDGLDISSQCQYLPEGVFWESRMQPQQQIQVTVYYTSTGLDGFYYQIPTQREIIRFKLSLSVDTRDIYVMRDSESDLLSPVVQWGQNSAELVWNLDRAVLAANMGIAIKQPEHPYAPYARLQRLTEYAPRAFMLGTIMMLLTLLIWGEPLHITHLALLAGGYGVQFFVVTGIGVYFHVIWYPWTIGAILTNGLILIWLCKYRSIALRVLLFTELTPIC